MDDLNITMEESVEIRFSAIVFNDTLTCKAELSCEAAVTSLYNVEIDFRISFDESDDEDCIVIFNKNSFSYKIISVNDLKTKSKNDNDKVHMLLLTSPEPTVSYFDDLDYFKDFDREFPAIAYNDALTSKLDLLTEPTASPQNIDEFNMKDETSFSKCDEKEQNVLYFNDLFSFNVIYPDDSKLDKDNDDDKVDTEHSLGDLSVKSLPDVINTDVGAYAHGSNKLLETSINTAYPGEWIWNINIMYSFSNYGVLGDISKRQVFWSFNKDILKINDSDYQYAVSIKEDTTGAEILFRNSDSPIPSWYIYKLAKYAQDILIQHGMTSCDSIGTPMATKHLDADLSGTPVDEMKYRSKVGALMYLTASRPDIMHAPCYCARYQAQPTEKHLTAVKRIFRYLKDTIHMGLWYLKDTGFELTAFLDSDHAGCLDLHKSTYGGIQFLGGDKLVSWSSKKQDCTSMYFAEAEYVSLSGCCAQVLWMRTQLTDYGFYFDKIPMYWTQRQP
uniref:Uncharacterized mitochondrial protein AtMg00810-like n=1 Tax=Tanacetum cinerariifolium TaxID=118510 RepID=A0A6L2KF47_TANCI|nr:uncharacterized mitochondrial protein AtMg00810-like [Tanacetum cinerariifolium]